MDVFDKIKVFDLLKEREELFADIFDYESRFESILGIPFDMEPPELISTSKKRFSPKGKASSAPSVRRLKPAEREEAYKVEYSFNGQDEVTFIRDHRLINKMLSSTLGDFTINRVSSIFFSGLNEIDEINVLYELKSCSA